MPNGGKSATAGCNGQRDDGGWTRFTFGLLPEGYDSDVECLNGPSNEKA